SGPTQQRLENSQIMFSIIEGVFRILGSGPAETRLGALDGPGFELAPGRQAALRGAQHLQGEYRGYAGPALDQVHSRIGGAKPRACCRRGTPQHQPLALCAFFARIEGGRKRLPILIKQQRILQRPPGKNALGKTGYEDDLKRSAIDLVNRSYKDPAVPPDRRLPAQEAEPFAQDLPYPC